MFIHKNNHAAVEALLSQTRSFEHDGFLPKELDGKERNLEPGLGHAAKPGEARLVVAPLRGWPIQTVTNGNLRWCEVAHQLNAADSPTGISAQIDHQAL